MKSNYEDARTVSCNLKPIFRHEGQFPVRFKTDIRELHCILHLEHSIILLDPCASQSYIVHYHVIMKTCLYNFDLLKPHFYIVKLGFTGINIIFLILLKKNLD